MWSMTDLVIAQSFIILRSTITSTVAKATASIFIASCTFTLLLCQHTCHLCQHSHSYHCCHGVSWCQLPLAVVLPMPFSPHTEGPLTFFFFVCFSRKTQIKINMQTKLEHNCSLRVHITLLAYFVLSWSGSWEIRRSWDLRFPIILFGLQSCFLTSLKKMEGKGVYREERPRDTNLPSVDFN